MLFSYTFLGELVCTARALISLINQSWNKVTYALIGLTPMLYSMQTCMRLEKYGFSWTRIPITNNPFKITTVLKYKERALRKKLIYSTQIFIGHIVLLLFVIRLLIMRQGYNWRASKGTMTCLRIDFLSNFWNSLLNVMLILCWRKYWPEWFERQFSIFKTWVSFFFYDSLKWIPHEKISLAKQSV